MISTENYRAIADRKSIEVLASPVRQEIVDTMAALRGEASVAELAAELGRHADGLYYHLKLLLKAGLIVALEKGESDEQRYRLAGGGTLPLRLAYSPDNAPALRKFVHGLAQVAEEDFTAALELDGVVMAGAARQLWAARNKCWLSREELVKVNALLEQLCDIMSQPRAPERDQLVSCAFVLAPLAALDKRRQQG
jgi:DNA-binding transcriptional ArsR family regulator